MATALLFDFKLVSKDDAHLIISQSKVQSTRDKLMKNERVTAINELKEKRLDCIFFDGRKDETKVYIETKNGQKLQRTVSEDHYTLTDPFKYLTHFTLDKKAGAKGVAEKRPLSSRCSSA